MNFKSIILTTTLVFSSNAYAVKPPPKPAVDIVCDGCVGTTDIESGAVTSNKLSIELQQQNSELDMRVSDNTADIQTNTFNVGVNTTDISANATAIQENTAAINNIVVPNIFKVLANGVEIGSYVTSTANSIYVLSGKDYVFGVTKFGDLMPHVVYEIRYEFSQCRGQAYISTNRLGGAEAIGPLAHGNGIVFSLKGNDLYVPSNAASVTLTTNSRISDEQSSCQDTSLTTEFYPVYQNDSAVTGVTLINYPLPLSIGR